MLMRMPVPTSAAPQGPARGKGRGNLSPMSPTLACAPPRPRQAKTACVFSRRDTANRPNGFATAMTRTSSVACHRHDELPRPIAP